MTALAGCVGSARADLQAACERILKLQSEYGRSTTTVETFDDAAFGIALHKAVPEDEFDRQPLVEAGRFLLVADVRLDNREELVRALGIAGGNRSDAEILLHAWKRWREGCLAKIVGDYAFAVWNFAERQLNLVRDPTGQRPLFYVQDGECTAFSSMPNGLLNWPQSQSSFDLERLARMMIGVGPIDDASYFTGIQRVRPGHVVSIGPATILQSRHWRPPQDELHLSGKDYIDAYRQTLQFAVRSQLRRNSGAAGVHLSSGFDSSAVAATAAQVAEESKPLAFTSAPRLGFNGPVPPNRIADEAPLAALTARKHRLEHIVVRTGEGPLTALRNHCRLYQEPFCDVFNMEWVRAIFAEGKRRGVTTLLTGEMGNLTIHAGGLPVLAEWLRAHEWNRWWLEARAAARNPAARWRGILINSFGHNLPAALQRALDRRFRGVPNISEQSFLRQEWQDKALASQQNSQGAGYVGRYQSRFDQIARYDVGLFRKGALAEFGIEERDPTADRRLLDFSFALPPEQLLHNGVWRPLARRALADVLPTQVLNSPVRGYQGADWYERVGQDQALQLLEEIASSHAVNQLLDLGKMRSAIERWPRSGWADPGQTLLYRTRLPIALATGVFIQLFEPTIGGASVA